MKYKANNEQFGFIFTKEEAEHLKAIVQNIHPAYWENKDLCETAEKIFNVLRDNYDKVDEVSEKDIS